MRKKHRRFDLSSCINRFINLVLLVLFTISFFEKAIAQNVGIGTPTPLAKLHVAEKSVAFTATGLAPDTLAIAPVTGIGRRMMWFAEKGAFMAGYSAGSNWDGPAVGKYSFTAGFNCSAQGNYSVAMGIHSFAVDSGSFAIGKNCVTNGPTSLAAGEESTTSGQSATASGYRTRADGDFSTAFGYQSYAPGLGSVAMGFGSNAIGEASTALGTGNTASGFGATGIGSYSSASGIQSITIGDNLLASGDYSIAMGSYVSTTNFPGCFTIGDRSTTTVMQTFVANGFRARFAGGYRLFTNSDANIGAFLNANANSWAALSDMRKKENFLPVDGETILHKIADMPQFTWNYIGQDPATFRHYGPMGQEFFHAFGHDQLGEIGCDTLINQQDFLGVNFIAIQALEKRTREIKDLKEMILQLRKEIEELKKKRK